jgi:hypothetical protein
MMQVLHDGTANYLRHKPSQLDKVRRRHTPASFYPYFLSVVPSQVVRWMVNDPSHSALGLALPATSGPTGRTAERAKGNVRSLGAGETFVVDIEAGALSKQHAEAVAAQVDRLLR